MAAQRFALNQPEQVTSLLQILNSVLNTKTEI